MHLALLISLALAPLAATSLFSEFELSKWLVAGLALSTAAVFAWRQGWDDFLRQRFPLIAAVVAMGALGLISVLVAWSTDPQSAWIDAARLGLPLLTAALVTFSWSGLSPKKITPLLVGSMIPGFLVIAQLLMDHDWLPFDVPHLKGEWTSMIGNGALVGESALVLLGFVILATLRLSLKKAALVGILGGIPALILIFISDSRAVWLGFVVFLVTFGFAEFTYRSRKTEGSSAKPVVLLLGGLVLLFGLIVVLAPRDSLQTSVGKRLASIVDPEHPTNIVRTELANDALSLWSQNKMVGIGGGRFGAEHARVRQKKEWVISGFASRVDDPHNEYLRFLCEYGLLGTLLIGATMIGLLFALWRRRNHQLARLTLSMWLGVLLIAATWATFQHPATMIPLAFLTGLALTSPGTSNPAHSTSAAPWRGTICASMVILLTLGMAIWAERNSAATALRDRGEALKIKFATASAAAATSSEQAQVAARVLGDLGIVGKSLNRVANSGWLRPSMRFRLLSTISNLAEQNAALAMLRPEAGNVAGNMLFQAAASLPTLQDVRDLAQLQLERSPAHLATLRLLGRTEMLAANKAAAVWSFEEALRINPNDPFARQLLAELYVEGETGLYQQALNHLDDQVLIWGDNATASDAAWQLKARCLGAVGRLNDALKCVEEWTTALGDTDRRRAIGGELSLFLGETDESVGLFVTDQVTWGERQERGTFKAGSFEGLPPREMRKKLLAHLGRHPHDTPVLDRLQNVLFDLSQELDDQDSSLERMRNRVIARARVHYAWENHLRGDERNLRVCLRIAKRKAPKQNDPYFVEVVHAVTQGDFGKGISLLKGWKARGVEDFSILKNQPDLASFLAEPEVQAILAP